MPITDDPRARLIEAAQRLLSERGTEEVSSREIAVAAGNRNNSAVKYHFGSRDELFREVYRARIAAVNRARRDRLDRLVEDGRDRDPRALIEAVVMPLAENLRSGSGGPDYVRFIARLAPTVDFLGAEGAGGENESGGEGADASAPGVAREIASRLTESIGALGEAEALRRVLLVFDLAVGALAAWEGRHAARGGRAAADGAVGEAEDDAAFDHDMTRIVDALVGALQAPGTVVPGTP